MSSALSAPLGRHVYAIFSAMSSPLRRHLCATSLGLPTGDLIVRTTYVPLGFRHFIGSNFHASFLCETAQAVNLHLTCSLVNLLHFCHFTFCHFVGLNWRATSAYETARTVQSVGTCMIFTFFAILQGVTHVHL